MEVNAILFVISKGLKKTIYNNISSHMQCPGYAEHFSSQIPSAAEIPPCEYEVCFVMQMFEDFAVSTRSQTLIISTVETDVQCGSKPGQSNPNSS